jgi:ATP-dependent helicase HrpA
VDHLRKKYPMGMMAKVELPRLGTGGTSLDDLILLAADGAAGGNFPKSPDAFRDLTENARGRWFEAAAAIGACLDEMMDILPGIREWLARHRNDRNLGGIAEDIDEQLAWLFRPRFAWRAGFTGLCDYPRRLRAIRSRLGRVNSLPIIKDTEKMERLRRLWLPWFRLWTEKPDDPALWPIGWAVEEYRVSLFAPDVPCVTKVSEKHIAEMLGKFISPRL